MGNFNVNLSNRLSNRQPGVGGKIGGSIFLLIFLAFGLVFSYLLARDFSAALKQRNWTKVDCVIDQNTIVDNHKPSDPKYTLNVSYTYFLDGKKFTGTLFGDGYTGSSEYYETQKLAQTYPVGSHHNCFANPADPAHAVLQQKTLAMGFFIVLPLVFVLIGGGGIYLIWRPARRDSVAKTDSPTGGSLDRRGSLLLCSIFILAGALVSAFWLIPTILQIRQAKNWPQVPCTIIHSGVSSHSSDNATTYAVEVLYRYRFNGQEYKSSRYEFMTGSSSGYDAKQDIVNALLANRKTVCYVNPADPAFAVLNRGYSPTLLFGLIPLAFVGFGALGLVLIVRNRTMATQGVDVPSTVKTASPMGKVFGALFLAAFWNGIVSVFVMEVISSWQHHHPDYFLAVFLIPFVFVGVILIGNFIYQIAAALGF